MNGIFGAVPATHRRREMQLGLAVVSGVLATDQVLKWLHAGRAGVERGFDPALWPLTAALTAFLLSAIALIYLWDRGSVSAPVVGLMLGGMMSATIDTTAGPSIAPQFFSIADFAVATALAWATISTVLNRLLYRDPVISARQHHLAA